MFNPSYLSFGAELRFSSRLKAQLDQEIPEIDEDTARVAVSPTVEYFLLSLVAGLLGD